MHWEKVFRGVKLQYMKTPPSSLSSMYSALPVSHQFLRSISLPLKSVLTLTTTTRRNNRRLMVSLIFFFVEIHTYWSTYSVGWRVPFHLMWETNCYCTLFVTYSLKANEISVRNIFTRISLNVFLLMSSFYRCLQKPTVTVHATKCTVLFGS